MLRRMRALRSNPTDAERRLWRLINRDQLGVRFRRQHRIGNYIVDFVSFDWRLIVELDGSQHAEQADYDGRRDAWLARQGFKVLRFHNGDVLTNPEGVVERIIATSRVGVGASAS